jgi:hypothetical protein
LVVDLQPAYFGNFATLHSHSQPELFCCVCKH